MKKMMTAVAGVLMSVATAHAAKLPAALGGRWCGPTETHVDMLDYHRCTTRDGKNPLVMRLDGNYRDNENHASPSHIVGVKVYDHEVSANGTPSKVVRYLVKQVGNGGATISTIMWVDGNLLRMWSPDNIQDKPITCVGLFSTYATRDEQELSFDDYKNDTDGNSLSSIKGEDGDYTCYLLWGGAGHSPFKGLCEDNQRCRVVGTYRKRVGNAYFVDFTDAHGVDERAIEGDRTGPSVRQVPMQKVGGTFVVPVEINGAITLDFTIDSGAADVSVPLDVFSTLRRKGTIQHSDVIGEQTYVLADGSTHKTYRFTIRSLRVGDIVIGNVTGGVAPMQGSLLLGLSFLERLKSWSIDSTNHVLLLEPQ